MKRIILTILFFALVFSLSYRVIEDLDLGWHIRVGQYIENTRSIPKHDIFTFSQSNYPYIYHSWASELLLFESYKVLGLTGTSLLYAFILTASVFALVKASEVISKNKVSYIYVIFASMVIYATTGNRIRIFGFLCLSFIYYFLIKFLNSKSKIVWAIPPAMMAWANLHGSFPFGIGFLALLSAIYFLLDKKIGSRKQKLKTIAFVIPISAAATLVNPYFLRSWQNALAVLLNSSSKIAAVNPDWQSILFNSQGLIITAITILILILALQIKNHSSNVQTIAVLIFLVLSFITSRFLIGLLVILVPLGNLAIIWLGQKLKKKIASSLPVRASILAAILVVFLTAFSNIIEVKTTYKSLASYANYLKLKSFQQGYPAWSLKADSFLNSDFKNARVLNEANWGGLMLLKNPNRKLFYYLAMDNYTPQGKSFAFEYLSITNALPGWENKLEKYNVDTVYFPPSYPLVKTLEKNKNWRIIYKDQSAEILRKTS